MVEKVKKTSATSEPSKLKKVSVRKPKPTTKKEKKELTRRKRYDKLNTPLRLEKDIETEEKKKSEKS